MFHVPFLRGDVNIKSLFLTAGNIVLAVETSSNRSEYHLGKMSRQMPQFKSQDDLKRYLITSRLLKPDQWQQSVATLDARASVPDVLATLERRQLLSNLQTGRILKGTTDGLILGDYKLLYRNASGSFARVYRAAHLQTGRMVGLKLLRDRWAVDSEAVAGFHREAHICKKFNHPNIVPIYDVGSQDKFHYFTMEFIEGGNLRDFMNIRKKLPPAEACRCVYEICAGLQYALSMGATHRDLKLTNVLMSSKGVAKLVDFGLAGANSNEQAGPSDDVHRALEYAALERGTNARNNDPRSDLFFAGAILHELLSGKPAWPRTKSREERKQISRYTQCVPIRDLVPDLPDSVVAAVSKMMHVSPHERHQSAGEAMVDLQTALIDLGDWDNADQLNINPEAPTVIQNRTLLIVDCLQKRIKALKDYFGRHNLKTKFAAHPIAALTQLKGDDPPDGLLILADNNTQDTLEMFSQFQAYGRSKKVPCLAVFPAEEQADVDRRIRSSKFGATKFQPATLREIREHFEKMI